MLSPLRILVLHLCVLMCSSAYAERRTINFEYDGSALVIENRKFITIIDFIEEKNVGYVELDDGTRFQSTFARERFHYRFRRYSKRNGETVIGEGSVYEEYRTIGIPIIDVKWVYWSEGMTRLDPDGVNIEWSQNTGEKGFLYFHSTSENVSVVDERDYASIWSSNADTAH